MSTQNIYFYAELENLSQNYPQILPQQVLSLHKENPWKLVYAIDITIVVKKYVQPIIWWYINNNTTESFWWYVNNNTTES